MKIQIAPLREMGAYEALWLAEDASFKNLATKFNDSADLLPSDFVSASALEDAYQRVTQLLKKRGVDRFGVCLNGAGNYPVGLRDAEHPVELLYYQGSWELAETDLVAVVGTRKPSAEGISRAQKLARLLDQNNFTLVSGLAEGIDTAAHRAAIEAEGRTVAVIGTPISWFYPRSNRRLQAYIADEHLVVSQVPVLRYDRQNIWRNRLFFPERNKTMSALSLATVIVEANERSGTLTQARAALFQGRKLFILDSLCKRTDLTWPSRLLDEGAIRLSRFDQILDHVVSRRHG